MQPFIPAAKAQQNPVLNTQEPKIPKSASGQGVKNSSTTDKICFRCKQPGHLKKDCPEQPYCSRCRTRGHIPVKCPLKKQSKQQPDKRCKSINQGTDERHKSHREVWKRAQDQPQYSHLDNRCLNCEDDHKTHDCPTRQQHQAPPANNPVSSTGTNFQYSLHFQQTPPQQHLLQSQSTVGSSTPTLMVNNLQYQQGPQGQPLRQPVPLVQQVNQQVRPPTPQTFNQQYNQYQVPQASPLLAQPQYNPQIPPHYPGQWQQQAPSVQSNPSNSNSDLSQILHEQ